MKLPTRDQLVKRRETTIADLQSKAEAEDWHGVMDCAADLREIDMALKFYVALDANAPLIPVR